MMSVREVIRMYSNLVNRIGNGTFAGNSNKGKVNCYRCSDCGHITKTIDVDEGVTPYVYTCEKCGGSACSSMYQNTAPDQKPTIEWYRPSLKKCLKMRSKHEDTLRHILYGGLVDRPTEDFRDL